MAGIDRGIDFLVTTIPWCSWLYECAVEIGAVDKDEEVTDD